MLKNIKLTQYSSGAGWACKLSPEGLKELLSSINNSSHNLNQISFETSDDASLYTLENGFKIIQSVDFFTPIVDDPFTFGKIAAANALSDIYAMGGEPLFALNIAAFPSDDIPISVLAEILNGGFEIAREAGIPILGGHTIKDKEPKYGLVVTGKVEESKLTRNNTAQNNDLLVLTKPIGTGIISTAIKKNIATNKNINDAIKVMTSLNHKSSMLMNEIGANSCTDITGYGLLGHLLEMCEGSNLDAIINYAHLPIIDNVEYLAKEGCMPGGSKNNYNFVKESIINKDDCLEHYEELLLSDAQTSGGLLISIQPDKAISLVEKLNENCLFKSKIIGQMKKKAYKKPKITIIKD